MLWSGTEDKPLVAPESVEPGVAVCLTEEGSLESWWVLEDSTIEASGVDNEIAAGSALAKCLLGKKIGEEVTLSEGVGIERKVTVKEILPKLVFRLNDVLDQFQYRFPDKTGIWRGSIGSEESGFDFSSFFRLAQHHREHCERAEKIYRMHRIPIGAFARALGTNEIRATGHIAEVEVLSLRCYFGTEEEREKALNDFERFPEVVLELSGIATLLNLGEFELLGRLGKKLLISYSSMEVIRNLATEADTEKRLLFGKLDATENGPTFAEHTGDQKKAKAEFFNAFLSFAEENFNCVVASDLPSMDPDDRTALNEALGQPALESVAIASQGNRILWTDDGALTYLARDYFDFPRIWTQAGLYSLADTGVIEGNTFNRISAKLIGWGYTFTWANPEILHEAGTIADWNPDNWPLKQAIEYLKLPEVMKTDSIRFGVVIVVDAYAKVALSVVRSTILIRILETIGERKDITELDLDAFYNVLPDAFGVNQLGLDEAKEVFVAWRNTRRRGFSL